MDKILKKNLILGIVDIAIVITVVIAFRIIFPNNQNIPTWDQIIWLGLILLVLVPSVTIGFNKLFKNRKT